MHPLPVPTPHDTILQAPIRNYNPYQGGKEPFGASGKEAAGLSFPYSIAAPFHDGLGSLAPSFSLYPSSPRPPNTHHTHAQEIYHSNRASLNHIHCDALLRAFANLLQRRGDSVHSDPSIEVIFTDLITRVLCAAASETSSNTGTHYSRNIAGALWSAAKVKYRGLATLQYVLERAFQVRPLEQILGGRI